MTELYNAASAGDFERVKLLVEQGADTNQVGGSCLNTALGVAAGEGHIDIIRYLVEQGADMEKADKDSSTPLLYASEHGRLEVARYLLEQGANRDKAAISDGHTPLHCAAECGHLETAKLLMVYGADLNARNRNGELPIDLTDNEEIRQAISDEPRRRMDHGHKRATEQDRHPNAAAPPFAQQKEDEEELEPSNKKPRLDEGAKEEEGTVADEDQDSEPSDAEEDD